MSSNDRNLQFLLKCKSLLLSNRLHELIIPDKRISYDSLLSLEQIMASHYATAIQDQSISPHNFRNCSHYSIPIIFAFFTKALKQMNLQMADRIISTGIKQQSPSNDNRHLLAFNKIKILGMQGQIKKAIFHCQNLLKWSGNGSDYYTYQFLRMLIAQGRLQQAFKIAQRHIQNGNVGQKHKIQSIYIYLLSKIYQTDDFGMFKKIQRFFSNRSICVRNIYNIAIMLKQKNPQKSLQLFKKLTQMNIKDAKKLTILSKINILSIQSKYLTQKSKQLSKIKKKQILQQCQQIINQLEPLIQDNQQFTTRKQLISENLKCINQQIKNDSNKSFIQAITERNKCTLLHHNKKTQVQEIQSEAFIIQQEQKQNKMAINLKYFNQKRAENERRLKFLLKKQRELKKFFETLRIQKNGSKINIKIKDKCPKQKASKSIQNINQQQLKLQQVKYQQKKKKYQIIYQDGQINDIISNFIDEWVVPYHKSKIKLKNIDQIKKFIVNLQCQNEQEQARQSLSNITTKREQKQKKSRNIRVVKNNSSRKKGEKVLDLKNNDHISHQILSNLKTNIAQKKKQEKVELQDKGTLKQYLHEADIMIQKNKLEQAHELYVKMYKKFKQDRQKEQILLKIAENFQRLSFITQAQRTYIKCTKFNNTEAFFRLGRLQIRNGSIQTGIQNLQKANCIDRHNSRIQIQLIYAYSLLQQTTERALALANSLLARNPECLEALVMSSKILQKKGKLKQALDIALAIGNSCPSAPIFHYIGLLNLNDSNVSQAFKFFHKAVQCDSTHNPSLIEIATIISQSKPQQAIEILKNVLSVDPQNQLAFARLGKIYETFQNDYQNALLVYKKGLQYSQSYQNYVKIGDCQLKFGSVVDAYLSYKQALTIKKTPEVYEKIAEVHQIQHQQKKAMEVYVAALNQLPKDNSCFLKRKKYLYKLGKLSLFNQQFDGAYSYLCQAADMEENFQVYKLLGQACFGKGDYKQALHYYQKACALQGEDNLQILQSIAICFDKQEEYLASKQIYEKILLIDPKNIKCLNNLANILLILGKTNEAFYWFQFMLQQIPTNIEKRLRVADIYSTIGDWSKVEQHLMICYKQKESDIRVLQRLVNLYKEKRDTKQLTKFQKRLALIKANSKNG